MCLTLELFTLGFCPACRVRSAKFEKSWPACEAESGFQTQGCENGYLKFEIKYRFEDEAADHCGYLTSTCLRCTSEEDFHRFWAHYVDKTAPWNWNPEAHEKVLDYFTKPTDRVPAKLADDRWWKRTLRTPYVLLFCTTPPDDPGEKMIDMWPETAKKILLHMEFDRLGSTSTSTWDEFVKAHPFPPWWYNNADIKPPAAYGPGAWMWFVPDAAKQWDGDFHTRFDSESWLPKGYRYKDFEGNDAL